MPKIIYRWLPVPTWSNYEVSLEGRVRSLGCWQSGRGGGQRWVPGKLLKVQLAGGRVIVTLCQPDRPQTTYGVAYLVLWTFVRPPVDGEVARHYHDPDPLNCHVDNLRWGSMFDNAQDIVRHEGKYHSSKLTSAQVIEIRRLLAEGQLLYKTIAARFDVSVSLISMIKHGKVQKLIP